MIMTGRENSFGIDEPGASGWSQQSFESRALIEILSPTLLPVVPKLMITLWFTSGLTLHQPTLYNAEINLML